jgi:hypothetical protein
MRLSGKGVQDANREKMSLSTHSTIPASLLPSLLSIQALILCEIPGSTPDGDIFTDGRSADLLLCWRLEDVCES